MKNTRKPDLSSFEQPTNKFVSSIKYRFSQLNNAFFRQVERRPVFSFFGFLLALVAIIILGNNLRKPAEVKEEKPPVKEVAVFSIGKAPRLTFSGTIEKSGVIQITAQSGGIVQSINVTEGTKINKGNTILWLSNNAYGGNISAVSRQIAEKNLTLTNDNLPIQQEIINKRREIAEKMDTQADDIRHILNDSLEATKAQITLNEQILTTLDSQLTTLEQNNVGGINDVTILQTKQAKSGVLAALSGLKSGLRNSEYQSQEQTAPAQLSDLGREVTLKQLGIEEHSLNLSKEIAELNVKIARISESLMYPAATCTGVVEHINVYPGQSIAPGTLLATMVCDKNAANIVVKVSSEVAEKLSRLEKSRIILGSESLEVSPRYISAEPTDGGLHVVLFTLPEEMGRKVTDASSVTVEIPIGQAQASAILPYIPIDSVFQTQTSSFLYVASQSAEGIWKATGKEVTLGPVSGSYVEVTKGLLESDQVILNRNVISGDEVHIK